jgi:hypothetical protein
VEDVPPGAVVAVEVEGCQLALVNHHGSLYAVDRDYTSGRVSGDAVVVAIDDKLTRGVS